MGLVGDLRGNQVLPKPRIEFCPRSPLGRVPSHRPFLSASGGSPGPFRPSKVPAMVEGNFCATMGGGEVRMVASSTCPAAFLIVGAMINDVFTQTIASVAGRPGRLPTIAIGRLVPQCVYAAHAAVHMSVRPS